MSTEPNEPVYPTLHAVSCDGTSIQDTKGGLSKRELFAAMAMQGMCASNQHANDSYRVVAEHAIKLADALIAELNKAVR